MDKFATYYIEKLAPWIIGAIVAGCCVLWIDMTVLYNAQVVFDKTVDFAGILFGFLITVLTILMQTNNRVTDRLRRVNRFGELIQLNKTVIYLAGSLCLYSMVLLICKEYDPFNHTMFLQKSIAALYIFLIIVLIGKTYIFLKVFFNIIDADIEKTDS